MPYGDSPPAALRPVRIAGCVPANTPAPEKRCSLRVVRYDNRFFQLEPQSGHIVPARSKVWVCEGRYGRMSIESGGRALRWREIAAPVPPQGLETAARPAIPRVPLSVKKRKWTPPPSHPWHEPPRPKVQKRARRLAAS